MSKKRAHLALGLVPTLMLLGLPALSSHAQAVATIDVSLSGTIIDGATIPAGVSPTGAVSDHRLRDVRVELFDPFPFGLVTGESVTTATDAQGNYELTFTLTYNPNFFTAEQALCFYAEEREPNVPMIAVMLTDGPTDGAEKITVVDSAAVAGTLYGGNKDLTVFLLDFLHCDIAQQTATQVDLVPRDFDFAADAQATENVQTDLLDFFGPGETTLASHPVVGDIYPTSDFEIDIFAAATTYSAAVTFYYAERAKRFFAEQLDHALAKEALIRVFTDIDDGTFYDTSTATVSIATDDSRDMDFDANRSGPWFADNREWHELAHHLMNDTGVLPVESFPAFWASGDNHGGYWKNSDTADSFIEGFAPFISLALSEAEGDSQPWVYSWGDTATSLEVDIKMWEPAQFIFAEPGFPPNTVVAGPRPGVPAHEEFAVAGFLWDIHDAQAPVLSTNFAVPKDDRMSVGVKDIFEIIKAAKPENVKQLYDALKASPLGSVDSEAGQPAIDDGVVDLDEIAIVHGMHNDGVDATGTVIGFRNFRFDTAELATLGSTGSATDSTFQNGRPLRNAKPPIPGSYIRVTILDGSGQPVSGNLSVEFLFDPPNQPFGFMTTTTVSAPSDLIHVTFPSLQLDAMVRLSVVSGAGHGAPALKLTQKEYFDAMATLPSEFFLEHTFNPTAAPAPGNVATVDQGQGVWSVTRPVTGKLLGGSEVPANSGDPNGSGQAVFTFNQATEKVCFNLELSNVQGTASAAHIHAGKSGVNGPVVVDLQWPTNAKDGCVTSTGAVIDKILANPADYYINVHSDLFPAGAVRGQLGGGPLPPFFYGNPADNPFLGDWDGDGLATPGLHRASDGKVYLRNSNTAGIADIEFFFGNPGDIPIVGDWDGDGDDTVSLYRPSEGRVYIINRLGSANQGLGAAETSFMFGDVGDTGFFGGDFDGDGRDTVGLKRGNTWYWRNSLSSGASEVTPFTFGDPGDEPVFGDWDGDGDETVGVWRPSTQTFFLRNSNTPGLADMEIFTDGFESGDTSAWSSGR